MRFIPLINRFVCAIAVVLAWCGIAQAQSMLEMEFNDPNITQYSTSQLTYKINNTGSGNANGLIDNTLPSGIVIAETSLSDNSQCGSPNASLTAGGSAIKITGISVPGGQLCMLVVTVAGMTTGNLRNTVNAGGSFNPGSDVTATLNVGAGTAFSIQKAFGNSSPAGGTSTSLTFTIYNPTGLTLSALTFKDSLPNIGGTPAGNMTMVGSSTTSNSCGGSLSYSSATRQITFSGGSVPGGGNCSISVDVNVGNVTGSADNLTSTTSGKFFNTTVTPASEAYANYSVTGGEFKGQKSFSATLWTAGDPSPTLTLSFSNSNTASVNAFNVTDTLPTGMTVGGAALSNTCGFAMGSSTTSLQLTGGNVAGGGGTCEIVVPVNLSCPANTSGTTQLTNTVNNNQVTVTSGPPFLGSMQASIQRDCPAPTFNIGKYFETSPVAPGEVVPLTLTIGSSASSPSVTITKVTDDLPETPGIGLQCTSNVAVEYTCDSSNYYSGTFVCSNSSIPELDFTLPTPVVLSPGGSCSFKFTGVYGASSGSFNNTITRSNFFGNFPANGVWNDSPPPGDTLEVKPGFKGQKAFAPSTIAFSSATAVREKSTLTVTLKNQTNVALSNVQFTDNLPVSSSTRYVAIAPTPNIVNTCGGTVTVSSSSTPHKLQLSGGSLPVNPAGGYTTCSVAVDVIAVDTTGANPISLHTFTNNIAANVAAASATKPDATVLPFDDAVSATLMAKLDLAPANVVLNKDATPTDIVYGQSSRYKLFFGSLTNQTNVTLTDTLPVGQEIFNPMAPSSNCSAVVTGTPGTRVVSITIPYLPASDVNNSQFGCVVEFAVTQTLSGNLSNDVPVGAISTAQASTNAQSATKSILLQGSTLQVQKTFANASVSVGSANQLKIRLTNNGTAPYTNVSFTDALPANVLVASPSALTSTGCGSSPSLSAVAGAGTVSGSGITIAPATVGANSVTPGVCEITLNVVASVANCPANYVNTILKSNVSGTFAGSTHNALADTSAQFCAVGTLSNITHSKSVTSVMQGASTNQYIIKYQIDVDNAGGSLGAYALSDTLNFGGSITVSNPSVVNVSPAPAPVAGWTGQGVNTVVQNAGTSIAAGATHSYIVTVTATVVNGIMAEEADCSLLTGSATNSGFLNTATLTPAGGTATLWRACVAAPMPLVVTKAFAPPSISSNGVSVLSITVRNPNAVMATAVGITDSLPGAPSQMKVASTPNAIASAACGSTAVFNPAANATSISMTGGRIAADATCTLSVNVTASAPGIYNNITMAPTAKVALLAGSNVDITGNTASAPLTVAAAATGALTGKVWEDTNNNGTVDATETNAFNNATVYLCQGADVSPCNAGNATTTTTTISAGVWTATGLMPGEVYTIAIADGAGSPMAGYLSTTNTNPSNSLPVVASATTNAGNDGYIKPYIGIAKRAPAAATAVAGADFEVPYTIKVKNYSGTTLTAVKVYDKLAGSGATQFGALDASSCPSGDLADGAYCIKSGPSISTACTAGSSLTLNNSGANAFTGAGAQAHAITNTVVSNGTLLANGECEVTFTVKFDPTGATGTKNNTATTTGIYTAVGGGTTTEVADTSVDGTTPDVNGNADPTDDTLPTPVGWSGSANLAVTKAIGSSVTNTGINTYRVNYTVTVANTGTGVGTYDLNDAPAFGSGIIITGASYTKNGGAAVTISTPATTTWTMATGASLDAGATDTYVLTVDVRANTSSAGGAAVVSTSSANCTISSGAETGTGLLNRANMTTGGATTTTPDVCLPVPVVDLIITKDNGVTSVREGGNTIYTITITNSGASTSAVTGALLKDPVATQTNVTLTSVACTGGTATCPASGVVTLANLQGTGIPVDLGIGQNLTFKVIASIAAGTAGQYAINVANIMAPSDVTEPVTTNNTYEDKDLIKAPSIGILKSASVYTGTGTAADPYKVSYTVTVNNNGLSGNYTLFDTPSFASGINFIANGTTVSTVGGDVSGPAATFTYTPSNNVLTQISEGSWPIGNGQTHTYTVVMSFTTSTATTSISCVANTPGSGLYNIASITGSSTLDSNACTNAPALPGIGVAKKAAALVDNGNGTYTVPYTIVVKNLGNETLKNVTLTDQMAGATGAPNYYFGTYVAGGNSAVLAAGQYTMRQAPLVTGTCTNGTANAAFTGSTDTKLLDISSMSVGTSCTLTVRIRFMPAAGVTQYNNQATGAGTGTISNTPVTDLSDDGSNPTGSNGSGGSDDPTTVQVAQPGGLTGTVWKDDNNDGVVDVGEGKFNGVTVYLCPGQNVASCTAATPGVLSTTTNASGVWQVGSLVAGDLYTVKVAEGTGDLTAGYLNTNLANPSNAPAVVGGAVTPAGNDGFAKPVIGLAKSAPTNATNMGGGDYEVQYSLRVKNFGTMTLASAKLYDKLTAVFGTYDAAACQSGGDLADGSYCVGAQPAQVATASCPVGNLLLNANFTGAAAGATATDNSLVTGGVLTAGQECLVTFAVRFDPTTSTGTFNNTATARGTFRPSNNPDATTYTNVSDVSTDGVNPDTNGDGVPDESTPTPVAWTGAPNLVISKDISSNVTPISGLPDNYTIAYTIKVDNSAGTANGDYDLQDIPAFGAGITVTSASFIKNGVSPATSLAGAGPWPLTATTATVLQGATDTYVLTVNVAVNPGMITNLSANCDLDTGETKTGLRNRARMVMQPAGTVRNTVPVCDPVPVLDLGITKTNPPGPLQVGGTTRYTLTVTNSANSAVDAVGALVQDPALTQVGVSLFGGVVCSVPTDSTASCPAGSTASLFNKLQGAGIPVNLQPGQSLVFKVNANVTGAVGTLGENTATVTLPAGATFTETTSSGSLPNTDKQSDPIAALNVPVIGVAKKAAPSVDNGNGTYTIPYSVVFTNLGNEALNNVVISDALAGVGGASTYKFGTYVAGGSGALLSAAQYTVQTAPAFTGACTNGAANAVSGVYTGSGTAPMAAVTLANVSSMAIGATCTVTFSVRFAPTAGVSQYNNQAQGDGVGALSNLPTTDLSDDGINPDTNGNGNPGDPGENDPTIVNITLPSLLSGHVFRDNNSNAVQDAGDVDLPTVTVTLTPAGGGTPIVVQTDSAGNWSAAVTPSVVYTVVTTAPNGLSLTTNNATQTGTSTAGNTVTTPPVGFAPPSGVSGKAWRDANQNKLFDTGPTGVAESVIPGMRVEAVLGADAAGKGGVVKGSAITDANGNYTISNLAPSMPGVPASNYVIRFVDPASNVVLGVPVSQDSNSALNGTVRNGVITGLSLLPGTVTANQNLPLDASGVVYDAVTRKVVPGAAVTLSGPSGFDPTQHLVGGTATVTTPTEGTYQFLLTTTAPAGDYSIRVEPPAGYVWKSTLLPETAGPYVPAQINDKIVAGSGAPSGSDSTRHYYSFSMTPSNGYLVFNNHLPLDPALGRLVVTKVAAQKEVELGDSVQYTIEARNMGNTPLANVALTDRLPAGFRYIDGTARYTPPGASTATPLLDPVGKPAPTLQFSVGNLNAGQMGKLTYFVRVGVGSQQGDGINRVVGQSGTVISNEAQAKVLVKGGVFTTDACVVGKVFVDCNRNHIQDPEELGIPGVRLYLQDGRYVVTDEEGKYSQCGLPARTHVIKVDSTTLPRAAKLTTTSNRNAGDGNTMFLNLQNGELARADFAESSCSYDVLQHVNDQIKARRSQGQVTQPETEKPGEQPRLILKPDPYKPILPQPRESQRCTGEQGQCKAGE